MSTFFQRVREESAREGEQRGEVRVLLRQMRLKFGEIPEDVRRRVEQAEADTLLTWSERILTAERIEDIFR